MHAKWLLLPISALLFVVGCDGGGNDDDATFELVVSPEFVQGALPGVPVTVLVTAESDSDAEVALEVSVTQGEISVAPERFSPGEIVEVTYVGPDVTNDLEVELTITASRGAVGKDALRRFTVVPIEDDRGPDAREILAEFLAWLEAEHHDLDLTAEMELDGHMTAPMLLVVSHYSFFDDKYELGLSWHIMVPPDDWAELYIRPRDSLAPTRAFRLSSWSTALQGGEVAFEEVDPPAEVVR